LSEIVGIERSVLYNEFEEGRILNFSLHLCKDFFVYVALSFSLASCAINHDAKLRISHSEWPGYEYLNFAVSKGFVPNSVIVPLTDQSEVVRAYLREEIDVVQLTTVDILDICSRQPDRCPVVVLVLNESLGGDQVMTLNLNHLRELSDKKIGVATSGFGPFVLEKAMQSVDLSIDDVSIVPMLVSEMPRELSIGNVDAVVIYPPNSEKARSFGAKTIFDSSKIPGQILDVLAVSPSVYASRKKDVTEIISGWFKAHNYQINNASEALAAMALSQGLAPDEFTDVLKGLAFHVTGEEQSELLSVGGPVVENLEAAQKVMVQLNLVTPQVSSPRVSSDLLP